MLPDTDSSPGGANCWRGQAQFMMELHKAVKAGVDGGKKLEELQASVSLPETVSHWVSAKDPKGQVKDAFNEISAKK